MLFQTHDMRYQQDTDTRDGYAAINQRALARVVGMVAVGLPAVLWLAAHLPFGLDTCFRDSLSHFYYAPFWGTVFTGALAFIGAYLIVYKGEDVHRAEKRMTTYAGLGAFGVALFPTSGWGCEAAPFAARPFLSMVLKDGAAQIDPALFAQGTTLANSDAAFALFPYASVVHYGSAAFLFFFLAWFCFFVFTAVDPHQRVGGRLTRAKMARNTLYYLAGTVILGAMALMGFSGVAGLVGWDIPWWDEDNWTFWCETAALVAFGVSWLTKGRFLGWLEDEARAALD